MLYNGHSEDTSVNIALFEDNRTGSGGASISGVQVRDLNTFTGDKSFATLDNNTITLTPGQYVVLGHTPATLRNTIGGTQSHQAFLYNVDSTLYDIIGSNAYIRDLLATPAFTLTTYSFLVGYLTLTANTQYQVRHFTELAVPANGLGIATGSGERQVYTQVAVMKLG